MSGNSPRFEPLLPDVHPNVMVAISIALTLLVGIGDYITGIEIAFTLLYLLPIALCTWYAGWRAGALISMLSAVCATADVLSSELHHVNLSTVMWNELGSLFIFLMLAYVLGRLREYVAQEQQQKRAIVEQLRHADRLNVIGTLAAGVAHELGTPLNVISGSAELLVSARSREEISEMSGIIHEQALRIGAIIQHLLDFGHRAATSVTEIDLNSIAGSSVALLTTTARKHACKIALSASPQPVRVRGNASELEQVVSNLVLNAIQAMPSGGDVNVSLGVTARRDSGGHMRELASIEIADEGTGIAASDIPRIFDPFFTTKGVGEGTGLGLSVSYGIVRDHQGAIEVDSAIGRGTKFTVLLPLDTAS